MKGYNGVAILSRMPMLRTTLRRTGAARATAGTSACRSTPKGGPVELHDFYVPAGGDIPDRVENPKYGHKLDFVAETTQLVRRPAALARGVMVGDLNIAPLEHDVWSHKQLLGVVSHTPPETEGLMAWLTPASSTRCGISCRRTRSSTRGGRIATATGAPRIAGGGWTMSGSPPTWRKPERQTS